MSIRISVSPHGRLVCETVTEESRGAIESAVGLSDDAVKRVISAFEKSSAEGLLLLAGSSLQEKLPAELLFWSNWARQFFQVLCRADEERLQTFAKGEPIPPPDQLSLAILVAEAPPMRGLEYLNPDVLKTLWLELAGLVRRRGQESAAGLAGYLREVNPFWHLLGRVTFHLAENKRDANRPFAFLATYAHKLSAKAQVQHLPLAQALKQYAGERDRQKLEELLQPVRAASDASTLIKELLSSRALFQPQAWTISQAYRFLRDVPVMEQSGLVVRVPDWWKARKPPRPSVQVRIGEQSANAIGLDGLLDFSVAMALDGEVLTDAEREQLLAANDGLVLLRGKWVEVNRDQLQQALDHWQRLEQQHAGGIDFLQGMRLLAGAQLGDADAAHSTTTDWIQITAGDWLRQTLEQLRDPSGVVGCTPGDGLNASLRPYQSDGVRWLWFLTRLGLGACLADDMGLGKTIQVIDLLLRLKCSRGAPRNEPSSVPTPANQRTVGTTQSDADAEAAADFGAWTTETARHVRCSATNLLIVPASLIGNWKQELARFAPQLTVFFAHRSECDAERLDCVAKNPQGELAGIDVVMATYTLARKVGWLRDMNWQLVVLDEAQAIKNASSAQTKAVKKFNTAGRIVLTGTPVENHLGDLWSLFDFCCPGLLGSANQFKDFVKRLNKQQDTHAYGALRRLVQPYILRRLKTDPDVVPDLPEKTEMRAECGLSKKQAVLYQQIVTDLERQLEEVDGMQRRGLVLATLMRLKQICNHPSQYLNQHEFAPAESGKFARLAGICEAIAERQEKVLVFTQFQSLCEPLATYLADLFGQSGLVLHGGVPVGKRQDLVRRFQNEDRLPFFVISVKAGGTGLNLTAASHVVHFDRWWNPAVENQATDRAFRIGQKRNVLVHKFVCRGTIEERIDQMIRDKQDLADQILKQGAETLLTELSDRELLKLVALDLTRAVEDS